MPRWRPLALTVAALWLLPLVAAAHSWSGVDPGTSGKADVEAKLGKATKPFKPRSGAYVEAWSYQFTGDDAKQRGVKQANFYFDTENICRRIDIFPARTLRLRDIEATFGGKSKYRRRLTSTFQMYVHYAEQGLAVFFEDDGDTVFSLQYLEPAVPKRGTSGTGRSTRGRAHDRVRMTPPGP